MTITVSTTDKRDGKALALFARHGEWQQGKTRDGRSFFAVPGSEPGLFHMADQNDCSCPDRQHARNVCKHMRAVRLWMAAYQTGAVAPKPRPATPAVEDDAGVGDELVILTPEGARVLAPLGPDESRPAAHGQAAPMPQTPERRYEHLFPACAAGGGDLPETRDGFCHRCASEREFAQRMAARHAQ
jgi:hypothetical protein